MAAVAVGCVAAGLTVLPGAASATTGADDDVDGEAPAVRLVVADIDAVVGPVATGVDPPEATLPQDVELRLLVDNPTDRAVGDASLVIEALAPVADRAALHTALADPVDDGLDATVLHDETLASIASGDVVQLRLTLAGDDGDFAPPRGAEDEPVRIRPLRITVQRGTTALDRVTTVVVGLSGATRPPVETMALVPIDSEPRTTTVPPTPSDDAEDPDEGVRPPDEELAIDPDLLPGGRVDRLTTAVEAAPAGTVAIAPATHTVEALAAAGQTVPGTTELLGRIQELGRSGSESVVSTPLQLASVPTLTQRDETRPLADAAVRDGRARLAQALGTAPGRTHLGVDDQTPAALDVVPGDLLVTRWGPTAGVDLDEEPGAPLPPPIRTAVSPAGRSLLVLVADPWIDRVLREADGRHGTAIEAHRVVAETAAAWAEDPDRAGRALAVVAPSAWDPPGALATDVVTGLAAAPWLRLASPIAVADLAGRETAVWAPDAPVATELAAVLPRLAEVDQRFTALRSAIPPDEPTPVVFSRRDELLRAMSTWPTTSRALRARDVLGDLDDALDEVTGVTTVPDDTTVTLASERGVVPVTVRRETGPPLAVVVEVEPQGRLDVDGDPTRLVTIAEGATTTVGFDTRALGTGTIPLVVRVHTPDRQLLLAEALISVRATAVSTPALAGVGLFVLLLLIVGRRRRGSDDDARPALEVVR